MTEDIEARAEAATHDIWDESRCGICGDTVGVSMDGPWCRGCGEIDCTCKPVNWREKGRDLLAELKTARETLAAVRKYGEMLGGDRVRGTWQGMVNAELGRILKGVA